MYILRAFKSLSFNPTFWYFTLAKINSENKPKHVINLKNIFKLWKNIENSTFYDIKLASYKKKWVWSFYEKNNFVRIATHQYYCMVIHFHTFTKCCSNVNKDHKKLTLKRQLFVVICCIVRSINSIYCQSNCILRSKSLFYL